MSVRNTKCRSETRSVQLRKASLLQKIHVAFAHIVEMKHFPLRRREILNTNEPGGSSSIIAMGRALAGIHQRLHHSVNENEPNNVYNSHSLIKENRRSGTLEDSGRLLLKGRGARLESVDWLQNTSQDVKTAIKQRHLQEAKQASAPPLPPPSMCLRLFYLVTLYLSILPPFVTIMPLPVNTWPLKQSSLPNRPLAIGSRGELLAFRSSVSMRGGRK